MKKALTLTAIAAGLIMLQGCAFDTFDPKPDDPAYAPALPQEDYVQAVPDGGIYHAANSTNGLYTDTKAHRVGDIISVQLEESTSAKKNAGTTLSKESAANYGGVTLGGKQLHAFGLTPTLSTSDSDSFKGSGNASQSNSLTGQISVSVVRVLANGNLQVQGEKWLMLNNGNEYVRVTGLIRPEDINSDNTVSSQRIGNARIQYGGTGDFSNTQQRGLLSRFFNSVFNIFS
ncbi:MAG: flagellar basal body L-ring protein FlgH [Succinivibrio sp.]|jgi:flagellar L-ring protein precursor FlgH|nr:flagellar basal body L-ring protein FlgH [Succinivibrio sp.]